MKCLTQKMYQKQRVYSTGAMPPINRKQNIDNRKCPSRETTHFSLYFQDFYLFCDCFGHLKQNKSQIFFANKTRRVTLILGEKNEGGATPSLFCT